MENKDKKPDGIIIYIFLVALVLCLIAVLGEIHKEDQVDYTDEQLEPIGGITQYMAHLQYWSLQMAEPNDIDILEQQIQTVSMPADVPETEEEIEEVIEDGTTGEDTRDTLLQSYFGYVPSDDEITLWQRVVMAECGYTEPDSGIMAVADCIANRCQSERFPDKITDVVYQPGQFQTVSNGAIWRYEVSDRVLDICADCISEGRRYDYLFFTAGGYNPYCTPGEVIGNHYFGY